MANFICKDCGHKWQGNDYTTECPNCGSNNIEQTGGTGKNPIIDFILKYKFYLIGVLGLIIIFMFVGKGGENGGTEQTNYPLEIVWPKGNQVADNHYKLKIKDTSGKIYNIDSRLIKFYGENRETNEKIPIKNGLIAPCFAKDNIKINITWKIKGDRSIWSSEIKNFEKQGKIIKFNSNKGNYKNAICYSTPTISNVNQNLDNGQLVISFENIETWEQGNQIMISIDGKNGTYKNQNIWKYDPNSMKKDEPIIIWTYHGANKKETLNEYNKGDKYIFSPPQPITEEEKEEIIKTIENKFNKLLNEGDSRGFYSYSKFREFNTKFDLIADQYGINSLNVRANKIGQIIRSKRSQYKNMKLKITNIVWDEWGQKIKKITITD